MSESDPKVTMISMQSGDISISSDRMRICNREIERSDIDGLGTGTHASKGLKSIFITTGSWYFEVRAGGITYRREGMSASEASAVFDRIGLLSLRGLKDEFETVFGDVPNEIKKNEAAAKNPHSFDISLVAESIYEVEGVLREKMKMLSDYNPNSEIAKKERSEAIEFIEVIQEIVQRINIVVNSDIESEDSRIELSELMDAYYRAFLRWNKSYKDDVVDGVMRFGLIGTCAALGSIILPETAAIILSAAYFGSDRAIQTMKSLKGVMS